MREYSLDINCHLATKLVRSAPMGVIASTSNMPSAKFQSPKNLDTLKANTTFTVRHRSTLLPGLSPNCFCAGQAWDKEPSDRQFCEC